ncbi:MAG TPA: VOC family protein [Acidimicrobiia bacterium]|jgi:PhnB protein
MAKVNPIPDGYRSVTPYLIIDGASNAIDFYEKVFGTKERMRMPMPDGRVGHAELELGDSVIMLADEFPDMEIKGPGTIGGSPVNIHIYVDDVDATFDRAVAAGADVLQPLENKFYGDRAAQLRDPFGHVWSIATHVEDVAPDEMQKRAEAAAAGG